MQNMNVFIYKQWGQASSVENSQTVVCGFR